MKQNIGTADKIIRMIIAIIVGVLIFTGAIKGTAALVLGILAAVFVLTALAGTCPLYIPFKISTKKQTNQ